ncbi:hypothetical protein [Methylomagnum sp.]
MSLQQHVLLRHQSEGHLRFALPAVLCTPGLGERLVSGLQSMEGIYRVDLYARQNKLSIRFLDTVCDFAAVVRRLYALIGELAGKATGTAKPNASTGACCAEESRSLQPQAAASGLAEWVREKLQEARETVTALGILAGGGFKAVSQKPRWMTEFFNDLLMLYLIKLHWHHILYLWLPNPWQHRYEWMATFYLIYLSVQARLPKPA